MGPLRGQLVETFVHNQLVKQQCWAEVDIVVDELDGTVTGIECRSALTVRFDDCRWWRALQMKLGSQFRHGVVFYLGQTPLSFGPGMAALPLPALWA